MRCASLGRVCRITEALTIASVRKHLKQFRRKSMANGSEILEAVVGLGVGGVIFIVFGSALAGTAIDGNQLFNFELWGLIYLFAAFVIAVTAVVGGVFAVLNKL